MAPEAAESSEAIISYVYKICMQLAAVFQIPLYSLARIMYYSSMCPLKNPFDTLYVFLSMKWDTVHQLCSEETCRTPLEAYGHRSILVKAECVLSRAELNSVICL